MSMTNAILNRYSCKAFCKDASLNESTLKRILALTQRAPTCFNSQPWIAVVVRRGTPESSKLVESAFSTNQQRVKDAPATVLFCADIEPTRNLDKMADLSAEMGYDREEAYARVSKPLTIVGTHFLPLRWIIAAVKSILFPILGLFQPVMTAMIGESTRTWSIKQCMMAADTFLLAATSHGLATSIMEGFDANRARLAVGLPRRYVPTVMISIGQAETDPPTKTSLRFLPEQVFFDGNYTKPFNGIEPVVATLQKTKSN